MRGGNLIGKPPAIGEEEGRAAVTVTVQACPALLQRRAAVLSAPAVRARALTWPPSSPPLPASPVPSRNPTQHEHVVFLPFSRSTLPNSIYSLSLRLLLHSTSTPRPSPSSTLRGVGTLAPAASSLKSHNTL